MSLEPEQHNRMEDRRTEICSTHKPVKWPEEVYPVCAYCGIYCSETGNAVGGRLNAEEHLRFLDWYTKPSYILSAQPSTFWYIARAVVAARLRELADWIEP